MCKERRAMFQKVAMEDNGTVHPSFSINLTKIQAIAAAFLAIFALFGSVGSAVVWTRSSIVSVVEHAWDVRLLKFHEVAKPEIAKAIREEISHHATLPAHSDVIPRITEGEKHDAAVDATLVLFGKQLERIEQKVDILIMNGDSHG